MINTIPLPSPTTPAVDFLLGDWLLTFHVRDERFPARHAAARWQPAAKGLTWQMWQQPGGPDWRGVPTMSFTAAGWRGWLLGELYGTADRLQLLRDVVEGNVGAAQLNGHFLLVAHEEAAARWHVWTDRLGTMHGYYAANGRRVAVGTFFPAVAAAASRRELDWDALTGFFGMGFFSSENTFYTDVHALRPATHYIFSGEGALLSQARYWEWNHAPDERRSYDETIAAFAGLFEIIMGEMTANGRVALPISGGLDSRTTIAALAPSPAGIPSANWWAYSYGYGDHSVETRIASRVAAARRLPFHAFTVQPYLFERLPLITACLEGFQDATQARQASITTELGEHADAVIAAHLGDLLFDDMGLDSAHPHENHQNGSQRKDPAGGSADRDPLHDYALKKMVKGGRQWLLDNLCQRRIAGKTPATIMSRFVAAGLNDIATITEPDFRMKVLKMEQWSARWTTTSMRMFQAAAFPRLPFYDTRLIDFFCTVPTSYVRGRQMQVDYLKRYAPDLARITWQVYDTNLYRYRQFNTLQLPKRVVKKAWRMVVHRPVIERNWEVQFLNESGRRGLQHWLLRPGLRLHDFAAPRAIEDLLTAFYAAPFAEKRGYTISMLLSFSAWLEQYG